MPTSRFSAHVPFQDVIHNKYYFLHFSGMMVFLAKRLMPGLAIYRLMPFMWKACLQPLIPT